MEIKKLFGGNSLVRDLKKGDAYSLGKNIYGNEQTIELDNMSALDGLANQLYASSKEYDLKEIAKRYSGQDPKTLAKMMAVNTYMIGENLDNAEAKKINLKMQREDFAFSQLHGNHVVNPAVTNLTTQYLLQKMGADSRIFNGKIGFIEDEVQIENTSVVVRDENGNPMMLDFNDDNIDPINDRNIPIFNVKGGAGNYDKLLEQGEKQAAFVQWDGVGYNKGSYLYGVDRKSSIEIDERSIIGNSAFEGKYKAFKRKSDNQFEQTFQNTDEELQRFIEFAIRNKFESPE